MCKKGFVIGLIVGVILNIILLIGTFACNWNPVEGSVIPSGICQTTILIMLFYPLISFSFIIAVILFNLTSETMTFFVIGMIISVIISTLIFGLIGLFIDWLIGKIKGKQ